MQRDIKLKLSTLLKAYDVKYPENSKTITFKNNFSVYSAQLLRVSRRICRNSFLWNFTN